MTTKHLNDDEVQQYVLDGHMSDNDITVHIQNCEDCGARVEAYRMLITGIKQQPVPVFDFDIQELILSKFPAPPAKKASDNLLIWIFILPVVLSGGLVIYLFRDYFPGFFAGAGMLVTYLVVASAIIILAVLCADMYKTYKKKIRSLDLY